MSVELADTHELHHCHTAMLVAGTSLNSLLFKRHIKAAPRKMRASHYSQAVDDVGGRHDEVGPLPTIGNRTPNDRKAIENVENKIERTVTWTDTRVLRYNGTGVNVRCQARILTLRAVHQPTCRLPPTL